MSKAPKATDSTTPKKRTRKAAATSENSNTNGNGTHAVEMTAAVSETAAAAKSVPVLEDKIRARAYELYLRRHGQGGSPEQDWFQAVQEICGQQSV